MATGSPFTGPAIEHEAELVGRLQRGDDDAYEELVRTHAGRLLSVARRYLDDDAAHDAVQEAFLNAFRAIARFDGRSRLATWLHRIVVNVALMRLRARRSRPETSLDELLPRFLEDGHAVDPPAPWPEDPHAVLERAEARALVRNLIEQLPHGYRTVLLLRDIEELDTRETAAALGISPGAVKVRLHRARQALRTLLDPHLREVTP